MSDKYILENGEPKKVDDPIEWATWFGTAARAQRQDVMALRRRRPGSSRKRLRHWCRQKGEPVHFESVMVSTIFLGLDHNFFEGGPPVLWETMVFGGEQDRAMWRYSDREEALRLHEEVVEAIYRTEVCGVFREPKRCKHLIHRGGRVEEVVR